MNEKEGVVQWARSSDNRTLFCDVVYKSEGMTIFAYGLIIVFVIICLSLIYKFLQKRDIFPVRERAPRIAALQCSAYVSIVVLLFLIESGTNYGWLQWENVTDPSKIPFSRKLAKTLLLTVRVNIYVIFLIRIAVIYYNWKGYEEMKAPNENIPTTAIRAIIHFLKKIFSKERYCMILILLYLPAFSFFLYFFAENFKTKYPSLDWFVPGEANWKSEFLTSTNLHAIEVLIMYFSYYLHRHFPEEFNLSVEVWLNLGTGWLMDSIEDFSDALRADPGRVNCIGFIIRGIAFIEIVRCSAFVIITYAITMRKFRSFPLPYSWVFDDFSKFLFEPRCVTLFVKYLRQKEPTKTDPMHRLMRLYVSEFTKEGRLGSVFSTYGSRGFNTFASSGTIFSSGIKLPDGKSDSSIDRQRFLEFMVQLEPSFERFKRTNSGQLLLARLKEFEEITAHAS